MPENLGVFEFVGGDVDFLEHGGVFAAHSSDGSVVLLDIPASDEGDELFVTVNYVASDVYSNQNDKYVERALDMLSLPECPLQRAYCYAEYGLYGVLDEVWLEPQDTSSIDAALAWEGPWGFLKRIAAEAQKYHL